MRLATLDLADFRNIEAVRLEPGERFNLIYGDNAAGKTNLLESIYLVAFLKSFRSRRNRDLIRWDTELARVSAVVEDQGIESRVDMAIKPGERTVSLDGKRVRSPMSYYGLLTAVLFGPDDLELTKGSPEIRRRYLDRILFVSDPGYWQTMRAYSDALQSRNKLLQSGNTDVRLFRSFELQLAEQGLAVLRRRQQIVDRVSAVVGELITQLAHWKDSGLNLNYAPSVKPVAWTMETYLALLDERRLSDARRGFTSLGPHKDDLDLRFANNKSFRNFASQGQHRLVSILLKITEMEVLRQQKGSTPVLLLDDVSSELDRRHYELFKTYMGEGGGQVFLTTTHPEFILLDRDRVDYQVDQGRGPLRGAVDGVFTDADALEPAFFDQQAQVMAQDLAVDLAVVLDVVEGDVSVALDKGEHHPREVFLGEPSRGIGLGRLLGCPGRSLDLRELVFKDALFLAASILGEVRRRAEGRSQIPQGDLGELGPQPTAFKIADELGQ